MSSVVGKKAHDASPLAGRTTAGPAPRPHDLHRFLYHTVSRKLREQIAAGLYEAGAQLPSAQELASEFGVSLITIRRALRDLTMEGHLIGRQGLGVFVASKRKFTRRLLQDRGFATFEDELRAAGVEPSFKELGLSLSSSGDEQAPALEPSGVGLCLDRLVLADDEPIALDRFWFPKNLTDAQSVRDHLAKAMASIKRSDFAHIDLRIAGSTANEEQARLLKIVPGLAVFVIRTSVVDKKGNTVLSGRTLVRADRFEYEFRARPGARK